MKNQINKYRYILLPMLFILFVLNSCEDAPPNDYLKKYYVEAYIFVGEPIRNFRIMTTQPINDTFNYKNSFVKDAQVTIKVGNDIYPLVYDNQSNTGYYYADTNIKVLKNTQYFIEIVTKDGSKMNATTTTPGTTNWTYIPFDYYLQHPKDSTNTKNDTNRIRWESVPGTIFYLISMKCKDTLNYGDFLTPKTLDSNERIDKQWNKNPNSAEYKETTRWGFIPNNLTPIVWSIFKWYGKQTFKVWIPDEHFLNNFIQYQRTGSYDPQLSNIKGDGIGVFGSASYIEKDLFLLKEKK